MTESVPLTQSSAQTAVIQSTDELRSRVREAKRAPEQLPSNWSRAVSGRQPGFRSNRLRDTRMSELQATLPDDPEEAGPLVFQSLFPTLLRQARDQSDHRGQ